MNHNDRARAICIFSLILYCLDNGSDFFVSVDLFQKCHVRYGASVLFFIVLPGIIYGCFKYFKYDSNSWKDFFRYFIAYPIIFIPMSLLKLAIAAWDVNWDDNDSISNSTEDDAKW